MCFSPVENTVFCKIISSHMESEGNLKKTSHGAVGRGFLLMRWYVLLSKLWPPLSVQRLTDSRKAKPKRKQKHTWTFSQQRTSNWKNECSYLSNSTPRWDFSALASFLPPSLWFKSSLRTGVTQSQGVSWDSNYSSQSPSLSVSV